jgi:hypothetical protein
MYLLDHTDLHKSCKFMDLEWQVVVVRGENPNQDFDETKQ